MDFLLGPRGGLDERSRGAGGRLGQTGAQRTLQLCDVVTILKEMRNTLIPAKYSIFDSFFCF